MSLGKLPVLKGFVSNSHNKRRYKSDLTVDMISPPLGDFRHTMHVGRGGDVFGDTSFLSNHGGGGGGGGTDADANKSGGLFSRTLRHVRKTPASRVRGGSRELSPPPPAISPIIKNAISLPQLVDDTPNGGLQRELFKSLSTSEREPSFSYGFESGFCTLPRLSRSEKHSSGFQDSDVRSHTPPADLCHSSELQHSDSLTSFTLDLGPSLMSEVMELIERSEKILGQDAGEDHLSTSFRDTSISEVVESPSWKKPWQSPSHLEYSMSKGKHVNGDESLVHRAQDSEEQLPGGTVSYQHFIQEEKSLITSTPRRKDSGMDSGRFKRAANVLERHYGGSKFLPDDRQDYAITGGHEEDSEVEYLEKSEDRVEVASPRRAPFAYPEEEDEIKV
ncbi:BORG5 protein, partial [Polypterus senegalus]